MTIGKHFAYSTTNNDFWISSPNVTSNPYYFNTYMNDAYHDAKYHFYYVRLFQTFGK